MRVIGRFFSLRGARWLNRIVLLVALLNGLLYLSLVPPWQHYDEPTHFEYAWLIANRGVLPEPGDYDQDLRRQVAASMIEHNFFRDLGFLPNLLARDEPIWIGISELLHPPLYYLLVALFLRPVLHADVTLQLYIARSVSLALYILSIWLAQRIVSELVPAGHFLRWAVPGMMALLPAYTDLMTAVNNDVGAVAVFSLFLWGAVRMIGRGLSWLRLVWVMGTAALCVWTKNTVSVAVLLAPLAVILALGRAAWCRQVWVGLALMAVALTVAAIGWGDAAFWYRQTNQERPTREGGPVARLGESTLVIEMVAGEPERRLWQPLLEEDVKALRGKTVTLGAWIWASEPIRIRSPLLFDGYQTVSKPIEVGKEPAFYAVHAPIHSDARQIKVVLHPLLDRSSKNAVMVYYDGIVLVEGARPLDQPPTFGDPDGREGRWGDELFVNRVRNGSGEQAWPWLRSWVKKAISINRRVPFTPASLLSSVLDWQRSAWVYPQAIRTLVQSFWAYFGWGGVRLEPSWYWLLEVVTAIGVVGAMAHGMRRWCLISSSTKQMVLFSFSAMISIWVATLLRVHPSLDSPNLWMPVARYAYPAIIPTALMLIVGWLAWAPQQLRGHLAIGLLLALWFLNMASLATICTFYLQ